MVTMKLINIDNDNGIAYFHCLPEGNENEAFDLGIDYINQEIVSNSIKKNNSYVAHAAWKIYDVFEETKTIPKHAISMWI